MAHDQSLPPSDRSETPADLADLKTSGRGGRVLKTYTEERLDPKTKQPKQVTVSLYRANEVLREKLREMRDAPGSIWSNSTLGNKLGYSNAVLSQYLADEGNKYPSDITTFEAKVEDFLNAIERRRASGVETCPAKVTEEIIAAFEYVRKMSQIGAVIAESGEGKSRAIEIIQKEYPLAILINVTEWNCSKHGMMSAIWQASPKDGYDRSSAQFAWLVQKLRGSDRPFIFDNSHKLGRDALALVVTFLDEIKCPGVLLGLPILVEKLIKDLSSQTTERVAVHWPVKVNPKSDKKLLAHMIRSVCKTVNGELDDLVELCQQVADNHGHFRAVEHRLKGAAELHRSAGNLTWCDAFRAAHKRSLHPCPLT
jgi:DNA transposition AAA+ family ATPase